MTLRSVSKVGLTLIGELRSGTPNTRFERTAGSHALAAAARRTGMKDSMSRSVDRLDGYLRTMG
jgi:hypothetical protein